MHPWHHSQVGWNIFRLAGDALHLVGMLLGLATIAGAKSVDGFSRKAQLLYLTVYLTRYLDLFTEYEAQGTYLTVYKILFIGITCTMLHFFAKFSSTYDLNTDSANIVVILGPVALVAWVTSVGTGFQHELWTYSEFLEPFALVPQYIMCYRVSRVRPAVVLYVLAVGGYRLLYVCNWIYKRYRWSSAYHDYISWCGGAMESVLFIDFVMRISQRKEVIGALGASTLGRVLLSLDDTAGSVSEKIEMNTIGRRLPFGMTGKGARDDELAKKQWDVSDQLVDEESCNLLTLTGDPDL